jgi:predicted nuclease with RNAse H fold
MSTSEPASLLYAGVDVGAERVHAALVRCHGGRLSFVSSYAGPAAGVGEFCLPATRVGVDAPGGPSLGAHVDDLTVAPKFRAGRCSEIPIAGVPAVSWVTPSSASEASGWMRTGFSVWADLRSAGSSLAGVEVVETSPAACFHRLNGGRWPPRKSTPAGRAARVALLSSLVELPAAPAVGSSGWSDGWSVGSSVSHWGHDELDAVACAVVAALGRPAGHVCPRPDGSVMWNLN